MIPATGECVRVSISRAYCCICNEMRLQTREPTAMKISSFTRVLPVVALAVLVTAALVACGSDNSSGGGTSGTTATPSSSASAGTGGGPAATVTIKDFAYSPDKIEIQAGTTVTWTNEDSAPHTVTSTKGDDVGTAVTDLFDSGEMQQSDTFSYTFDKPGEYYYECTIHATMKSMHAEVEVQ